MKSTTNRKFISIVDLGMAYRKAKVDLYYMSNPCILKILDYEELLEDNLKSLHSKLCKNYDILVQDNEFIGNWTFTPKCIDNTQNEKIKLISSDPNIKWNAICQKLKIKKSKPKAEFRLIADHSIDFHVVSTIWMSKVGHKYDEKLSEHAYGNRLRRKNNAELNKLSLGTFIPYLKPFRDWRDNGIKAMRTAIDEKKDIIAITTDVQSFYHELDPNFMLDADFLSFISLKLSSNEIQLTNLFIQALKTWARKTPLGKGLPVGLPASALVANMALIELDRIVQKELAPLYYGRYVDDIILVMENGSEFQDAEKVWEWIFSRSDKRLNWKDGEKKEIAFTPSYLKNSKIQFSSEKTKVFLLSGDSGSTMVNALTRQIHERASEWRALPKLSSSEYIATDLLVATQHDGEEADNLRKADSLSMRRSGFAIKLRDFEAYERDLLPKDWQEQRRAFLNAFIQHTLVLPVFFDLSIYLPRVIRLATACEDFYELHQIVERLFKLYEKVNSDCNLSLKANERKINKNRFGIKKWQEQIHLQIEENIKASFPPQLSLHGKVLWTKLFINNPTSLKFDCSIKELQQWQKRLFNHDLAHMPFRFVGLSKFVSKRGIPDKQSITYTKNTKNILDGFVWDGLSLVSSRIKCCAADGLPYGLLFSTRPFNLTELYLLYKDPYNERASKEISDSILALRGFSVTDKMPRCKNEILDIPMDCENTKITVALASWKTSFDSWLAAIAQKGDPDVSRYKRLTDLLNHLLSNSHKARYLVMPELSLPARWFIRIAQKLQGRGISFITGIEYLHRNKNRVSNQVWASLTHDGLGFPSMMIYRQDKQRPALLEEKKIHQIAGLKLIPVNEWQVPRVIRHGDFHFSLLICSELTNIAYRAALRGKIDALFVPEWNQDTETFNALVESAALDIHAYIIQCNDRQYGDSRIRAPFKDSWMRDIVRIKGGINDYFVIGEIDIDVLRQFQSSHRSPEAPFKPVPDGFIISHQRKTLPNG
ncbi:MAG: RNA-directed DNA polymerase [Lentisphaerota bacterium]